MKKLAFALGLFSIFSFAQENQEETFEVKQNELSVNLITTFLGKAPSITYERLANADWGYGTTALVSLDQDSFDYNFLLTPFARWYFLNTGNETNYGRRFFIEANAALASYDDIIYDSNGSNYEEESIFSFGLGLGIGYKYVNKSNWIGTINIGGGRLFNDEDDRAYPHAGISIGKRF